MEINQTFQLAFDLINFTGQHVFLTGKAGTGKTTFLKHLIQHTNKKHVVLAPTGVAAINAGGVTMHSFLNLPFAPFIPSHKKGFTQQVVEDKNSLFKNIRFNKTKIDLLKELELLIIDEISMVRADMLDATDLILRHFRRNHREPFGGIQVLYIGDMFQLPPVIKEDDWQILKEYYEGPYFFQSKVIQETQPTQIELTKIYRQKKADFITLLNKVRHNHINAAELVVLNEKYKPAYQTLDNEIILCTHNAKADTINLQKLNAIQLPEKSYSANIKGDFNENNVLADSLLRLKIGAQIMFLKNDVEGNFYNGKIGKVTALNDDEIEVEAGDESVTVKREKWKNIKYKLDIATEEINEETIGEFEQFPIKLAWAITIHKSQGLTFDKVCIDAGSSFSSGQVYVALSRCTTLDGITLLSKITPESIINDNRIVQYSEQIADNTALQTIIDEKKQEYLYKQREKRFVWQKNIYAIIQFIQSIPEKDIPEKGTVLLFFEELRDRLTHIQTIAEKFLIQLKALYIQSRETNNEAPLINRAQQALIYFIEEITEKIIKPLLVHHKKIKAEKRVKGYVKDLNKQIENLNAIVYGLESAAYGNLKLYNNSNSIQDEIKQTTQKVKAEKGSSAKITLELFQISKSVAQVAAERKLSVSTIESHLAEMITQHKISIYDFMEKQKIDILIQAIRKQPHISQTELKTQLNNAFTYGEIKAALAHYKTLQTYA